MVEDFRALSGRIGEGPTSYYRMGIHTGVATLGNLGSATRRDFSAIGDTVNLAKRLQENAQHGQIIVSDDTYRDCQTQLSDPAHDILVLQRASIQVKGRRQATQIYEIRRSQR
jgi:class 3 adenylate cyclase